MFTSSASAMKYILSLVLLCLSVAISSSVQATVQKSPNDTKSYRSITLDNQLRVLLISKPGSDKAAASMNVAVGSSANPEDRAGLAHFLEHMLFLGTEKFPTADEYQSFIRAHGGGHNAYTSQENTNYFFDVSADNLEPALDRFSQFFVAPLFNEKYVDRERHAVHSEYQAKIKDDYRRSYAVTKSQMNQENSHNRFAVGSLKTLEDREGNPVRDDLLRFYKQYYSANLMSLVILGRESLDELEELARNKFSSVKNANAEAYKSQGSLFNKDALPQKIEIQSVKDIRSLTLTFPIPETRTLWRQKPVYLISSLIGYEGKGSLLSLLKAKGWATALSASQGHNLHDQASFMVNIQLTEQGYANYLQVSQTVFQYIELLKQQGINRELFEEEKQLSAISFRFKEESEPIHLVSGLSQMMQHYPTEEVMIAEHVFENYDPELIEDFLSYLRPENLQLVLKSQAVNGTQTEPDYKVPFNSAKLSEEEIKQLQVQSIDSTLSVREINPFVAKNLDMLSTKDGTKPKLLSKAEGFEHWYMQDTSFGTPKTNVYFTLQSESANSSAKQWVLNNLFVDMLQEQLIEDLYDAYMAGLNTQVYPHLKGFTVRLSGYSDNIDLLLQKVINAIISEESAPQRFAILKQKYLDDLANELNDKPYNQTTNRLYELLLPQWENSAKRTALESISEEDLRKFAKGLLAKPSIKLLTHGNHSSKGALALEAMITTPLLAKEPEAVPAINVAEIPQNKTVVEQLAIDHNDSAISVLLQGENNSLQSRAEISVLSELLSAPFYNEMRTEKQLGYIVFATALQMNKTPGIAFIIQSPSADANQLREEVNNFLNKSEATISNLDEATLTKYKQSVISRILKKDNKLSSRSKRFWREIDWRETDFDSRQKLADKVQGLSLEQLKSCFEQLQTRKLVVLNNGNRFKTEVSSTLNSSDIFNKIKRNEQYVPEA